MWYYVKMCDDGEYQCGQLLKDSFIAQLEEYIISTQLCGGKSERQEGFLKNMLILSFEELLEVKCSCVKEFMEELIDKHDVTLYGDDLISTEYSDFV